MSTKTDFTEEEWQVLRWSVSDTILYVSMADPGVWDTFKEATTAAKYVANARANTESALVRDLAGDLKARRDKEALEDRDEVAEEVAERISEAVALVAAKAADELEAFKAFILDIATVTAESTKGVADTETDAIANIKAALG